MNARQEGTVRPDAATTPHTRAVIAKPALDEHCHSAQRIAQALRDDGFEVTCTKLDEASEQVVAVVIVDDAPISQHAVPSGADVTVADAVMKRLKEYPAGAGLVGGIVPAANIPALTNAGASLMLEWAC
ncbi:methylmalonyl-CoA mutase, C-terminal domain [Streptomyces sp. 3213]|uniref:methylmalonyl-CoA mutase n=1 Tax=Streptomyces sp. 3213.3 TaxID=1855348 RepID=UPI000897BACF|nr:methylmalonyl-CoA mutase [Streptomyces sp. 3213.3]SEF04118.1 methylmalonyl-CoA mutase, C-terminal domain [Streptomyces sp. 3213] [Streptomyces sp. 3213.3]